MRVLLHACCGPCASGAVPRLKEEGHEATLFFANSNIDTKEEYSRRLDAARRLAEADGIRLVALDYDHEEWLKEVAEGYEFEREKGARCARCFKYNLRKTAEAAKEGGYDAWTTTLTISPHKVSKMVFDAGDAVSDLDGPVFLKEDFKKREGFKVSLRRAAALGLYRQAYCGCEFSRASFWRIHHKEETVSTNLDARVGVHGDVFTADFQTAGRGRLDHKWLSPPKTNLMMSAVLSVAGLGPEHVATLPLVVGLSVVKAVESLLRGALASVMLKWPNDVYVDGRKVAGILCERVDDRIIVGVGVNVGKQAFPMEIAARATSLGAFKAFTSTIETVRDTCLRALGVFYEIWRTRGFKAVYPRLVAHDYLKGRLLDVLQTDHDEKPIHGVSGGIMPDGSLDVGGVRVYAGEAHVMTR